MNERIRNSLRIVFAWLLCAATWWATGTTNAVAAWVQLGQDIDGDAAGDMAGRAVAISPDGAIIAVGAPHRNGLAGEVRVYSMISGLWAQLGGNIYGDAAGDRLGETVALNADGSVVAVGSPRDDSGGNNAGLVRVFSFIAGGWAQLGGDIDGAAAEERFGSDVALSAAGTRVAINALGGSSGTSTNTGTVRVYELVAGVWTQLGSDFVSNLSGDGFAREISMSSAGDRIGIASINFADDFAGRVEVFEWTGSLWVQLGADISNGVDGSNFGASLSMSGAGDRIAAGATGGGSSGQVQVYGLSAGSWTQIGSTINGESSGDNFGRTVALSSDGTRVAGGAMGSDDNGNNSGHVRVYALSLGSWAQVGGDIAGEAAEDRFGFGLAMSGDGGRVIGGAHLDQANTDSRGQARVFEFPLTPAPTINCPSNVSVECGDSTDPLDTGTATATDSCSGAITITYEDFLSGDACTTVISRLWKAIDNCGHGASCIQTISILDTTQPAVTCPPDVTLELGDSTNIDDTGKATASDICDPNVVVTFADTVTGDSCSNTISRIWTATDECGLSSICTQILTVVDTSAPQSVVLQPEWIRHGLDIDGEAAGDRFGGALSVSYDGSRIAVGARHNDGNGADSGSVRIYEDVASDWVQLGGDIDGEAAGDLFGSAVSLSSNGTRVAIGAFFAAPSATGHVRVYDLVAENWVQVGADIDGELGSRFGMAVSISADGSRLAVSGPWNSGVNGSVSGHVRVFEFSGGSWVQLGSDIDGEAAFDWSGATLNTIFEGPSMSLSADGNRVAIGSESNDGNGSAAGHVRIFEYSGGSWTQLGTDIDGDGANHRTGASVGLSSDGSRVVIGRNNSGSPSLTSIRVYDYNATNWVQVGTDINSAGGNQQFGLSVSISADGNRVAGGAPGASGFDGLSMVYEWSGSTWSLVGTTIPAEAAFDRSGYPLVLSPDGERLAVGAAFNGENGAEAGHVRVFRTVSFQNVPFTCPPDITIDCGGSIDPSQTGDATNSVDANGVFTTFVDTEVGLCPTVIHRAWTVTDGCGNSATCTQLVTLADNDAPVLTCPGDRTVTNSLTPGTKLVYFDAAQSVESCDSNLVAACTHASGSVFPEGTTTVTCTATDFCGNSSTCSFNVVVVDDTGSFTDTDFDNIDDTWETNNFTNLTTVGIGTDFDMDGQLDSDEFLAGTDPIDPDSSFEVVAQVPATAQSLTWVVVPGKTYNIEHIPDLNPGSTWTTVAVNVTGGSYSDTDPDRIGGVEGYYRVVVVP